VHVNQKKEDASSYLLLVCCEQKTKEIKDSDQVLSAAWWLLQGCTLQKPILVERMQGWQAHKRAAC